MTEVVLITGGNLGSVAQTLDKCNELVEKTIGQITKSSSVISSKAWGFESDDDFLNQVLVVETELSAEDLLESTQAIEKLLGREKNFAEQSVEGESREYHSRIIDVDILFYGNEIISLPQLKIPHVMMHQRDFVLKPLCEVMPQKIHPVFNKTAWQLRKELISSNENEFRKSI